MLAGVLAGIQCSIFKRSISDSRDFDWHPDQVIVRLFIFACPLPKVPSVDASRTIRGIFRAGAIANPI